MSFDPISEEKDRSVEAAFDNKKKLAALQSRLDAAEACDVCGGTGTPVSGKMCICNGSGKMSIAVCSLREMLYDAETSLDAAEKERDALAREWDKLDALRAENAELKQRLEKAQDEAHDVWLDALGKVGLVTTYSIGETEEETVGCIVAKIVDERDELKQRCAKLEWVVEHVATDRECEFKHGSKLRELAIAALAPADCGTKEQP